MKLLHSLNDESQWTPATPGTIIDTLDTQQVANAIPHNGRKLRESLKDMTYWLNGHMPEHLHNAGNDAHWTLVNMLLMGIRDEIPETVRMLNLPKGESPELGQVLNISDLEDLCSGVTRWVLKRCQSDIVPDI